MSGETGRIAQRTYGGVDLRSAHCNCALSLRLRRFLFRAGAMSMHAHDIEVDRGEFNVSISRQRFENTLLHSALASAGATGMYELKIAEPLW